MQTPSPNFGYLFSITLIDRKTLKARMPHLSMDNYAIHTLPEVQFRLTRHPWLVMHFTPTNAPLLNMVERFFRDITVKMHPPRQLHQRARD